ncbi:MAG: hypothetical protein FJX78_01140 [Armatimonadetes bacterium]|nr:hypothetical protein [Armatimonadota bacterium]
MTEEKNQIGMRIVFALLSIFVAAVCAPAPAYAVPITMAAFTAADGSMTCGSFRFDRGSFGPSTVSLDLERILVSCVDLTLPDAVTRKSRAFSGLAFDGGDQFSSDRGTPFGLRYHYWVTALGDGARIAQAGGTSESAYTAGGIAFLRGFIESSFSGIDTTGTSKNPAPAMSTALRGEPPSTSVSTSINLVALADGMARLERWTQVFSPRVETAPIPPAVPSAALLAAVVARAIRRRRNRPRL